MASGALRSLFPQPARTLQHLGLGKRIMRLVQSSRAPNSRTETTFERCRLPRSQSAVPAVESSERILPQVPTCTILLVLLGTPCLIGCPTLSFHGVRTAETTVTGAGTQKGYRSQSCSAVCAQIQPNGQCGQWVEPVGEACRREVYDQGQSSRMAR